MKALRYDFWRLDEIKRTPHGGLQIPAALTRTGVFEYRKPDGSVSRELRHPDEVFHKDARESFANAPLTIGHVGEVNPDNWGAVAVGHVVGTPKQEGEFLAADCNVARGDAIKQVTDGKLKELSCGYEIEIDPTPGVYEGQPYDLVQREIRGNHVALLPEGQGRAGPDVKLRMDSKDGVEPFPGGIAWRVDEAPTQSEREEMPESQFADPENKKYPLDTPEHTRAAASYAAKEHNAGRLSDAKFNEIQARINKARKKHGIGEENKDSKDAYPQAVSTEIDNKSGAADPKKEPADVLLGRIDSLMAANTELQKKVDALPGQVEAAAVARASLLARVAPLMGKDWKADGKSDIQIVKDALVVARPEFKFDGKSDDYIKGAYEEAIVGVEKSRTNAGSLQGPLHPMLRRDADADLDVMEEKNKMAKKKSADAWKTPAKGAVTRDGLRK